MGSWKRDADQRWNRRHRLAAIITLSTLLFLTNLIGTVPSQTAEALLKRIEDTVVERMEEHKIPGVTLSVVKDGEILLSRGYGYANLEQDIPVDPERTLFRPGSVSKLLTWTAVMQLVEEERLDLDENINAYLDFEIPDHILRNDDPNPRPITLRHLMTHTPGFEDVVDGLFVLSSDGVEPLGDILATRLPSRVFPAGEILAYSNYGAALAGYIVERISGQAFEEYMEDNVLSPLEMLNSTFQQPVPDSLSHHLARGYGYWQGKFHPGRFEYVPMAPAGSMSTTASDMAHFMIAHLSGGRFGDSRILESDTLDTMHRQHFAQHPAIHGVTLGFFEDTVNGQRVLNHSGSTMLYYSHLLLVPEEQLGLFISFSGSENSAEIMPLPRELLGVLLDGDGEGEPPTPNPSADVRGRTAGYLGEYHTTRMTFTGAEKFVALLQAVRLEMDETGHLLASMMGQNYRFYEVEPDVYQNHGLDDQPRHLRVAFSPGPWGEPLLTVGAMTYWRAPWFSTLPFLGGIIAVSMILMVITLLGWTIQGIRRSLRPASCHLTNGGERAARRSAVGLMIVTLAFFLGMVYVFTDIDPAFGVPNVIFGIISPVAHVVFALPWLMVPLALILVGFSLLAWRNRYWNVPARVHYSLLSLTGLGLIWVLLFTNQI